MSLIGQYIIAYKRQNQLFNDPDALIKKFVHAALEEEGTPEEPKKNHSKSYI